VATHPKKLFRKNSVLGVETRGSRETIRPSESPGEKSKKSWSVARKMAMGSYLAVVRTFGFGEVITGECASGR